MTDGPREFKGSRWRKHIVSSTLMGVGSEEFLLITVKAICPPHYERLRAHTRARGENVMAQVSRCGVRASH